MLSRKTVKRLMELQHILGNLFDTNVSMSYRRRLALEQRASCLFDVLHDDLAHITDKAKFVSKSARTGFDFA